MSLEEDKTRLVEFGRYAEERCARKGTKPGTFTFLGFTHYCSHGRSGQFRVKRKTSRKKSAKKCKEIHRLIRDMRTLPLKVIMKKLNQILVGYYHYYGITDNFRSLSSFRFRTIRSLYKWLNRRSQRKSYNWGEFNQMLKAYPLAKPKIYVSVYAR
ncbi:MAG: RNA-directed DNA polymerase [Lachnospiraceae bacterium]|nr:RNA-directed DNA polymerase [Lachnospiraceae bacterium]